MKKNKILQKTLFLIVVISTFIACSTDESIIAEQEKDIINNSAEESTNQSEKINSSTWTVQSLGETGRPFKTNITNRYTYSDNKIWMKVLEADEPVSSGSTNPRTELRSTSANFTTKSAHKLSVTMNILDSSTKVVIGQLFSEDIGSDFCQVYLRNNKLYAQFDGNDEYELNNDIGSSISFSIKTEVVNNANGTESGFTTISHGGKSKSKLQTVGNCYFKTGVYLIDGGSATVEITKLSKN